MCYPIFTITLYLSHAPNTQKIQYNTNANAYTRESYARDDRADMQQSWMELILPIHRASDHVSTHTRPYPCAYRTANAAASTHVHTLPIILWLFNAIARARAHTLTHPVYFVPHNHVCVICALECGVTRALHVQAVRTQTIQTIPVTLMFCGARGHIDVYMIWTFICSECADRQVATCEHVLIIISPRSCAYRRTQIHITPARALSVSQTDARACNVYVLCRAATECATRTRVHLKLPTTWSS